MIGHKTKSTLLIILLAGIMILIGVFASFNEGITGGTIAESVVCYEDLDCNDKLERTVDICRNPGTEYSICINKPKEAS